MRPAAAIILTLTLCASLTSCDSPQKDEPQPKTLIELDSGWQFRETGSDDEWLPATVPGCVHTDLLAADAMPDPFFGDNEKDLQWIGEKEWIYTCTFLVEDSLLEHDHVFIEFEGLDTYAEITLNGKPLLSANNMFRRWNADIKTLLRSGENTLEAMFLPPGPIEGEKRAALGYSLPGGDRVFTRKAAYHYGWDWGPRLVTCGIWKPVKIIGWTGARITDMTARIMTLSEERARVQIEIFVDPPHAPDAEVFLVDPVHGLKYAGSSDSGGTFVFEFDISDPKLWWPNGLGDQPMYTFAAELSSEGTVMDTASLSFGLRTIELVTEQDEAGETFYFRVNGVPVFMKGANWIPMDSFLPRPGPGDYRRLLTAAKDANMNMLRVWGGGIYENDIFYELCDSLGILVWQDFMYACAMYPGDNKFLDNARVEAEENIRRLRHHPCLALWCGNNENDEGWHNWGWQPQYSEDQRLEIWKAYDDLFDVVLPEAVTIYDTLCYHPSSPRFGRADPRSMTEGDAHYWGLWHDAEPFEILEEKVPRFMSEFGFQSLPSMKTIEMFTSPEERRLDSAAMLNHQKHPRGFALIRKYMERWYRVPEKFEDYVYVSQLLQAEGMRIGFEAQRRAMPYCMGTLYWQLNDCWPAISWSSIDFAGQWKALHYVAKRAFEPVLVSTAITNGMLDIYIVSDRLEEIGGWMTMKFAGFDGKVLWEKTIAVKAPPNGSVKIFSFPIDEFLSGTARFAVVFSAEFTCPGEKPPVAIHYFAHPKDMRLPDPAITFEIIPGNPGVTLELTSSFLAKNVFLQLDGCHFSDNFFDILPDAIINITLDTDIPADEIKDRIRIRTLRDTY